MKEDQVYVGVAQKDNSNSILPADPKPIKDNRDLSSGAHRCWIRLCFPHFKTIPHSALLLPVAEVQLWHSDLQSPCTRGRINNFSFCLQIIPENTLKRRKNLQSSQHYAYRSCAHTSNLHYFISVFFACLGSVFRSWGSSCWEKIHVNTTISWAWSTGKCQGKRLRTVFPLKPPCLTLRYYWLKK